MSHADNTTGRILADIDAYVALRGAAPTLASRIAALRSRGLLVVVTQRLSHAHARWAPAGPASRAFRSAAGAALALARYGTIVLTKSQVRKDSLLEGGVYLSDLGHVIVGARSIGAGTVIHHRVTIGMRATDRGLPEIGRNVWIGASSVVYGPVRVGDGATILPESVVSTNVPPRAVVGGNPAVMVRRDFDNSPLLATYDAGAAAAKADALLRGSHG